MCITPPPVPAHRVNGDADHFWVFTPNSQFPIPTLLGVGSWELTGSSLLLADGPDLALPVVPQCGQMRCGAFGSWHWGQRPVVAGVSASCVRRLAVRVLECRRFGFGIVSRSSVFGLSTSLRSHSGLSDLKTGGRRPKPIRNRPSTAAARQASGLPRQAHSRTGPYSGSCRTSNTSPCRRPGTAASSAAPGRTVRGAAR